MQMLFIISGRILAVLVFVVSVVSWPMLLDRDKDVINAVATSIQIVNDNNWSCWCGRF